MGDFSLAFNEAFNTGVDMRSALSISLVVTAPLGAVAALSADVPMSLSNTAAIDGLGNAVVNVLINCTPAGQLIAWGDASAMFETDFVVAPGLTGVADTSASMALAATVTSALLTGYAELIAQPAITWDLAGSMIAWGDPIANVSIAFIPAAELIAWGDIDGHVSIFYHMEPIPDANLRRELAFTGTFRYAHVVTGIINRE